MSTISETDWNLFNQAYEALVARNEAFRRARDTNDMKDVREAANETFKARKAWSTIHNTTSDPKARAIAAHFMKQEGSLAAYAKPLERWSGGSAKEPGKSRQVNKDYPDVFVGVFAPTK